MTAEDRSGQFGVLEHHPAGQIVLTDPVGPGVRSRLLTGAGLGTIRGLGDGGPPGTLSMCPGCADSEDDDWDW